MGGAACRSNLLFLTLATTALTRYTNSRSVFCSLKHIVFTDLWVDTDYDLISLTSYPTCLNGRDAIYELLLVLAGKDIEY